MTTHTNGGWIESTPAVDIELLASGIVRVTDKSCMEQDYSVDLHPIHVRLIAEKLGLVREMSASEANTLRTCEERGRRLLALKKRIDHLASWLAVHADHEHADLTYETDYATATADVCDAYCSDIASGNAPSVSNALVEGKSPENGGVEGPQKRGSSAASEPSGNPEETQRVSNECLTNVERPLLSAPSQLELAA